MDNWAFNEVLNESKRFPIPFKLFVNRFRKIITWSNFSLGGHKSNKVLGSTVPFTIFLIKSGSVPSLSAFFNPKSLIYEIIWGWNWLNRVNPNFKINCPNLADPLAFWFSGTDCSTTFRFCCSLTNSIFSLSRWAAFSCLRCCICSGVSLGVGKTLFIIVGIVWEI